MKNFKRIVRCNFYGNEFVGVYCGFWDNGLGNNDWLVVVQFFAVGDVDA
jgi:hypothetical protein